MAIRKQIELDIQGADGIQKLNLQLGKSLDTLEDIEKQQNDVNKALSQVDKSSAAYRELTQEAQRLEKAVSSIDSSFDTSSVKRAEEAYEDTTDQVNELNRSTEQWGETADTATRQATENTNRFGRAISRASDALKASLIAAVVSFGAALTQAFASTREGERFFEQLPILLSNASQAFLRFAKSTVDILTDAWTIVRTSFEDVGLSIEGTITFVELKYLQALQSIKGASEDLPLGLDAIGDQIEDKTAAIALKTRELAEISRDNARAQQEQRDAYDNLSRSFDSATRGFNDFFQVLKSSPAIANAYSDALERAADAQNRLAVLGGELSQSIERLDKQVDDSTLTFSQRRNALTQLIDTQSRLTQLQRDANDAELRAEKIRVQAATGVNLLNVANEDLLRTAREQGVALADVERLRELVNQQQEISIEQSAREADNIERGNALRQERIDLERELSDAISARDIEAQERALDRLNGQLDELSQQSVDEIKGLGDTLANAVGSGALTAEQALAQLKQNVQQQLSDIGTAFDDSAQQISSKFSAEFQLLQDSVTQATSDIPDEVRKSLSGEEIDFLDNLDIAEVTLEDLEKFLPGLDPETTRRLREQIEERNRLRQEETDALDDNTAIRQDAEQRAAETTEEATARIVASKRERADRDRESTEELIDNISDLAQAGNDVLQQVGDFASAILDRQIETLERQLEGLESSIEASERRFQEAQSAAGESLQEIESLEEALARGRTLRTSDLRQQLETEKAVRQEQIQIAKQEQANQERLAKEQERINQEIARKERQRLQLEQSQAIADAVINTALAVTQTIAQGGAIAIPLATAIGALGAAQVATIAAQSFEHGGQVFAEGGVAEGPSHRDGGIPFTVAGRGGYEMEGGEFIVNKRSTAKFLPLLESINSQKFQDGGLVASNLEQQPIQLDTTQLETTISALANRPSFVSVQEIESVSTNVRAIENRADV